MLQVFEQLGDHIKRRNSVSEGISAFFSDDAPKKVDLDFTKDRGSKWASMRRASINGQQASNYKGASEISNDTAAKYTERRGSTRRGSVRSMNG